MVLSELLSLRQYHKNPAAMLPASAVFASVGVLVQILVPALKPNTVIFAMIPAIPIIWSILVSEARKYSKEPDRRRKGFLECYKHLLLAYAYLSIGAIIAYFTWFTLLPPDVGNAVFSDQLREVRPVTGFFFFNTKQFDAIIANNLQVLLLMLVFSLLYGIGSIYLLLWNASVLAVVFGASARAMDFSRILGTMPFASLEFAAYFIASVGGGVLSIALMHSSKRRHLKTILIDFVLAMQVALLLLLLGAVVESAF